MEDRIKELKKVIEETEASLKDTAITSDAELVALLNDELEKAKKELKELEDKASQDIKDAEEKLKKAKEEEDKKAEKQAKADIADALKNEKELSKISTKIDSTEKKVIVAEKKSHGGFRQGAGRKPTLDKKEKPKGKRGGYRPNAGRKPTKKKTIKALVKKKGRKLMKPAKAVAVKKSKEKSVKAFGQTVTFKSDAEFCSKLIKAFKKRRSVYKKKRTKTKPVFAVVTSKTADALNKAFHHIKPQAIKDNPKKVMADLKHAEKKAKEFLESLKPLMGSDYKHAEIAKEFGEIEEAIKKVFNKYKEKE